MKKPIAISITNNRISAARPSTADQESPNIDNFGGRTVPLRFAATRIFLLSNQSFANILAHSAKSGLAAA